MLKITNVMKKKFIAGVLSICLLAGTCGTVGCDLWTTPVQAATFTEINQSSVFLKQEHNNTCTLSAVAMMLRRAAMLGGNGAWYSITESGIRSTAWVEETGLRWNFTFAGIAVAKAKDLGGSAEKLASLLAAHPEGIVIYDRTKPHAVLVTDYTGGVFYCAEPAAAYPAGRIPLDQAFITLSSVKEYWYVKSPQFSLTPELVVTPKPPVVQQPAEEPEIEPTPTPRPDISTKTTPFGLGDVSGNGNIELADAQLALKAALKILSLNQNQTKAADANSDGNVELADAQKILMHALRIDTI